jgi:hypothetical protein
VYDLANPLAIACRNLMMRSIVSLMGGLPSDWLWKHDCKAVVEAA